ncbi:MAG TPA: diphosphomevalonate decarboxylase [Anaerolineae bacterium]|nr:diphosphomevalonate decarboxylase [Anaerolineae bacterium]
MARATAVANPNIAFIKYWGQADAALNLPANPSLSMNLAALTTVTTVEFHDSLAADSVTIDGRPASGQPLARVVAHLDRVRALAGIEARARVASRNDFPAGTGLASSASAFAALSLAGSLAAGLRLDEAALSRLARLASGSACRSVPAGFCLWAGGDDESSYARQVAPPRHWALHDVVAVVSHAHKAVGSYDGHGLAPTSAFHACRLAAVPALLDDALGAIEARDMATLGAAAEGDALAMHGVMLTSLPSLLYWLPGTVAVMNAVRAWRAEGIEVYFTLDAGPNVHCLCDEPAAIEVESRLRELPGVVEVFDSVPGGGARQADYHLF